jgi:hypothetical protein
MPCGVDAEVSAHDNHKGDQVMKSNRSSMLFRILILAIGALGASVSPAHAQSAANGKFTLPHEARWGSLLLSPGDYSFSLQSPSLPAPIMVGKTGSSQIALVLPRLVSTEKLTGNSRLVLSHSESGESFVSALYLGDLGVSLHFAPPKAQRPASETAKLGPIAEAHPGK